MFDTSTFLRTLSDFYREHGRHDMSWRQPEADGSYNPYKILVSEIMLQQTQVGRVEPKYHEFLGHFPTVDALAQASLGGVLNDWSGLGYNRRAKYLWQAAKQVVGEYGGRFPRTPSELQTLSGVGPNTAGAIMAYAYDMPVVYIETNIRTVLIYHLFNNRDSVTDKELREVLQVIVRQLPGNDTGLSYRELYYAFMDYGSHLKKTIGNLNRISTVYSKQSTFAGSRREIRGKVIKLLRDGSCPISELVSVIEDDRLDSILGDLTSEGLIVRSGDIYSLE